MQSPGSPIPKAGMSQRDAGEIRRRAEELRGEVGAKLRAEFAEVSHTIPMTSIDNAFEEEEVNDRGRRVRQAGQCEERPRS